MHKSASKPSVGISAISLASLSSRLLAFGFPYFHVWVLKLGRWCVSILFLKVHHTPITEEDAAVSASSLLVRSVQLEETFVSTATGI